MSKSHRKPGALSPQMCKTCNSCGMCCRNRGDISLTPLDVLRMSQFLKMYPRDFIKVYCDIHPYLDVRLKVTGPFRSCVFLKTNPKGKNSCAIYKVRPMACYLYPLKMIENAPGYFTMDKADYCPTTKNGVPVADYVNDKSGGRYVDDFTHIHKFLRALNNYYIAPEGRTEQEMLEYFFYNDSEKEIENKILSMLYMWHEGARKISSVPPAFIIWFCFEKITYIFYHIHFIFFNCIYFNFFFTFIFLITFE